MVCRSGNSLPCSVINTVTEPLQTAAEAADGCVTLSECYYQSAVACRRTLPATVRDSFQRRAMSGS